MLLTVQALRLEQPGEPTRRLVARLSRSLRSAGVLDIPLLMSVDDDREAAVLVGFADRVTAFADRVALARRALSTALAALGIGARPLELFGERIGAGTGSSSRYYRLAICETEGQALREFADRATTLAKSPGDLALLWIGRAESGDAVLVLTGYPDDSSFRTGTAIEDAPQGARRRLGVRVYAGEAAAGAAVTKAS
ncbi:MAG: hypothetical protein AUH85_06225 [Chloroflexi bacterium 13_1_40CM_4_68_4]|nr:MAG: hypothetical protein AUH85_06225 [Chloroflexi bacterium 13_1_40CM_4_68_4]